MNDIKGKSISLNAIFIAFVQLATKGIVFLVAIVIARLFGPADYGAYAIALTLTTVIMAFTDIGLEQQFIRQVSVHPEKLPETLGAFLYGLLPLTLLAVISMPIAAYLLGYSREAFQIVLIFVIYRFFNRLLYPFGALMRVQYRAGITAVVQFISLSAQAIALTGIVYFGLSIFAVAYSQVAVAIGTFIAWLCVTHTLLRKARFSWHELKTIFQGAAEFAPQTIAWILYFQSSTLILSFYESESEVGIYSALFRLLFVLYIVPEAFMQSCAPALYRSFKTDRARFDRLASFSTHLMIMIAVVAVYLLATTGGEIIQLIYGEAFSAGLPTLQWLLPGILFRIVSLGLLEVLTTSDHQRYRGYILQSGLALNILLCFALIPALGSKGAAIATSATELAMLLTVLFLILRLRLPVLAWRRQGLTIAAFALLLLAGHQLFNQFLLSAWLEFSFVTAVSGGVIIAMLWRQRHLLRAA